MVCCAAPLSDRFQRLFAPRAIVVAHQRYLAMARLCGSLAWYAGFKFRAVSLSETPVGNPTMRGQCLKFDWSWANPNLSLMLAPENHVRAIILPRAKPFFQPFDPLEPTDFPKLQRYGLDYGDYAKAILKMKFSSRAQSPLPPPRGSSP